MNTTNSSKRWCGAAEQFDVSEQFVEKDYYVTEILRIVAERLGDKAMFKGGLEFFMLEPTAAENAEPVGPA